MATSGLVRVPSMRRWVYSPTSCETWIRAIRARSLRSSSGVHTWSSPSSGSVREGETSIEISISRGG